MPGIKNHPILPPPSRAQVEAEAARHGLTLDAAAKRLLDMRAEAIAAAEDDPLRYGWESPIWKIADALLDYEWLLDKHFEKQLQARGTTWEDFKAQVRRRLGFTEPVRMLLILGGNRTGKSEYSAKRSLGTLVHKSGSKIYAFHESNPRSVMDQQPLFWKYLPAEWKLQVMTAVAYIKYKRKTGFSESSFITPNGSACYFMNYMQDRDTAIQGLEPDLVAPDELVPADWLDELMIRLVTRAGKGIVTFTPVHGWTPTVKLFLDSAQTTWRTPGHLLPVLGQNPDESGALGLTEEEYWTLQTAGKKLVLSPAARPPDIWTWLAGAAEENQATLEWVPRVARCVDPLKGVIWFHGADNPFGNPKELIASVRKRPRPYIRERFYGVAEKTVAGKFPRFDRRRHVLTPKQAAAIAGTNYHFMDPASGRNYYQCWIRVSQPGERRTYVVYREWPGDYLIPGVGIPGPWAIPSGRNEGRNDGARSEGQGPWGWGHRRYKFEIARLEGWRNYEEWRSENPGREYPPDEELEEWDERCGARELISGRIMDSRAASAPRIENDRPITLQTIFDDLLLTFDLAPGKEICEGESAINTALDYETDDAGNLSNAPSLYISAACPNMIYALENWTGADGEKGACKDPIDLLRYFFMSECEDDGREATHGRGGFSYGVAPKRPVPFGSHKRLPTGKTVRER
ncbi:MAG: hypothetical protein PHX05_00160 [Acidobacteriota bacterium]|nr:hypothetical protein [Acidobacteriota bacterium]